MTYRAINLTIDLGIVSFDTVVCVRLEDLAVYGDKDCSANCWRLYLSHGYRFEDFAIDAKFPAICKMSLNAGASPVRLGKGG